MKRMTVVSLALFVLIGTSCANQGRRPDVVSQKYIHKYGLEVPSDDWALRGKDGKVISTLEDGVTLTESYNRGVMHGETTYSYPYSDVIQKVEFYENDHLVRTVFNNDNGWPEKEERYLGPGIIELTQWYESSSPRSVERYQEGTLVSGDYYTMNHQIESQVVDGEGLRINRDFYGSHTGNEKISGGEVVMSYEYHSNGVLKQETPMVNGLTHGKKQFYLPTGELDCSESWSRGKQHGLTTVYKNGHLWREVPFVNGERQGVEKVYRNGSQVVEEITWYEGKKHGPHRRHLDNIVKIDWYYRDGLMPKSKHDHWTQAAD